jgi:hypothetical protein
MDFRVLAAAPVSHSTCISARHRRSCALRSGCDSRGDPMQRKVSSPRYRVSSWRLFRQPTFQADSAASRITCADRSWLPLSRQPLDGALRKGTMEFAARLLHQQNLHLRFDSLTLARWRTRWRRWRRTRVCERQAAKPPLRRLLLKLPVSRVLLSAFLHCNASRPSFYKTILRAGLCSASLLVPDESIKVYTLCQDQHSLNAYQTTKIQLD